MCEGQCDKRRGRGEQVLDAGSHSGHPLVPSKCPQRSGLNTPFKNPTTVLHQLAFGNGAGQSGLSPRISALKPKAQVPAEV